MSKREASKFLYFVPVYVDHGLGTFYELHGL